MPVVSAPARSEFSARRSRIRGRRVPMIALGIAAMMAALAGGLARLGWSLPTGAGPVVFHGPLMVAGFLGTVIGLERAVALGRVWSYGAPLATGLGALAFVAGVPDDIGRGLMALGSVWVGVIVVELMRRQPAPFTVVMALGTGAWITGQILWLAGWPVHRVVGWWSTFLTLTIAGERLELARLTRLSKRSRRIFLAAVSLVLAAVAAGAVAPDLGARVGGVGTLALAAWLGRNDIARRTVRQPGLPRFVAVALLCGYAWLAVSGVLAILAGAPPAGTTYDAMLHALFVGFVFSMIFGHAPIIFPAVLGVTVSYRPAFYAHLVLLHVTLVARIAGDLSGWLPGRQWGGLGNAIVVLLFLLNTLYGVFRPASPASVA